MNEQNEQNNQVTPEPVIMAREAILTFKDKYETLTPVEAFGTTLYVRALTASEKDKFEESVVARKGSTSRVVFEGFRAKMFALCVCDEKGKRLFGDGSADIKAIGDLPAREVDKVYQVISEKNSYNDKDIEEVAGN